MSVRLLVLCTMAAGLDSVAEVIRRGGEIEAIVGLDPSVADPTLISGLVDVAIFARKWNIRHLYVSQYDLLATADQNAISELSYDLVWVAGWQRLIPTWLIDQAPMGAVGGHGSPDGIHGGRGRSPQNWAIMLGCQRFDLALFKITPGVDDGPVVLQRSFFYNETDDISTSYKKTALCLGDMMTEVINNPALMDKAAVQSDEAFYYPQRRPEDGYVDWSLKQREIYALCRSLTRPYPGLRASQESHEISIWKCVPFDDVVRSEPGTIDFVFEDDTFLVSCGDGRVLLSEVSSSSAWRPVANTKLRGKSLRETINNIIDRHRIKSPGFQIAMRIANYGDRET